MAFTPLDGALSEQTFNENWPTLVTLFLVGAALFLYGVFSERRLRDAS